LRKTPSKKAVRNKLILFFTSYALLSAILFLIRLFFPLFRCLSGKITFEAMVLSLPGLILSTALFGLLLTVVVLTALLILLNKPTKKRHSRRV